MATEYRQEMLWLLWSRRNTHEAPRDSQTFHMTERKLLQTKWTEKIHGLTANCFSFLRGGIPWESGSSPIICSVGRHSQWVSLLPSVEAEENPNLLRWSQDWGEAYVLGLANESYSPETQCCSSATRNLQIFPWCIFPKDAKVVFMYHFCPQHSSTATCQSHQLPNHS